MFNMEMDVNKLEKALELFLTSNNLTVTVKNIKDKVYNANEDPVLGSRDFNEYRMGLCADNNIELSNNVLELFNNCWNHFPHKALGGKSPTDILKESFNK